MPEIQDGRTIYLKSREKTGMTRTEAASAVITAGYDISESSIKDYETGKTIPKPESVGILAEVYNTPELKWLHCSENCLIGQEIARRSEKFGVSDVYKTYFDLVGAFDKIHNVESNLHAIIQDDILNPDEIEVWNDVIAVLDEITESANELKVWAEKKKAE